MASHCNWDCTVSRKTNRLFHLGNCITFQCPSLNAKIWTQANLHACLHCRTCLLVQISSLPGPRRGELYPTNCAKWCKLGASSNIERHIQLPSCQRPQKGCTVFSEDQETVARTDGWCRHTDSVRSGPSEPQEPECALGLPSLRSLKPWGEKVTAQKETWRFGDSVAGTRKEERPKEFSFLNTIKHAQIPPKVISNHFKIWNVYNFHLVCMASSKDCLWRGELLRAVHLQS